MAGTTPRQEQLLELRPIARSIQTFLEDFEAKPGSWYVLPHFLLLNAARWTARAHDAAICLIAEDLVLEAVVVARTAYELATRMSWCARDPSLTRWECQLREEARLLRLEEEAVLKEPVLSEEMRAQTEVILTRLAQLVAAFGVEPGGARPPKFDRVLQDLEGDDQARGRSRPGRLGPGFNYAVSYRGSSHLVHGSALASSFRERLDDVRGTVLLLMTASSRLIEALSFALAIDIDGLHLAMRATIERVRAKEGRQPLRRS